MQKIAKWSKKDNCFFYIRNKFGKLFLERINHPEDDDGFDLFIPFRKIEDIRKEDGFEFSDINSEYFLKYKKGDSDNEKRRDKSKCKRCNC